MKLMKWTEMVLLASSLAVGYASFAHAEETMTEKAAETGRDIKKGAKKAGRAVSDEACEMVNGKMECAGKKLKHKAQNVGDEIKDKTDTDKN